MSKTSFNNCVEKQADQVSHDAFNIMKENDPEINRYMVTAPESDIRTALQDNRARYCSPEMRRWLSQDPLGFAAGDSNLYRYVRNSPENHVDPSGLEPYAKVYSIYFVDVASGQKLDREALAKSAGKMIKVVSEYAYGARGKVTAEKGAKAYGLTFELISINMTTNARHDNTSIIAVDFNAKIKKEEMNTVFLVTKGCWETYMLITHRSALRRLQIARTTTPSDVAKGELVAFKSTIWSVD